MAAENDSLMSESVSLKEKGMVLYAYLTLSGVSIEEAAEHFLDDYDETSSQKVSQVLSSYGFNEKSSGRFVRLYSFAFKRSAFSEIDINLFKQQDMAAFVGENPDGGTTPEEMEKFLRERINRRLQQQRSGQPILPPPQQEEQPSPEPLQNARQTAPQQSEKSVYTAPAPVKKTPEEKDTDKSPAYTGGKSDNADESDGSDKKTKNEKAHKFKWGKVVGAVIGLLLVIFIFNSACGRTPITCVSSSGYTAGCASSKGLGVDVNVGYFSDGSFDKAAMIIDDKFRKPLDDKAPNKFSANLSRGRHTVRVEYYKNGTLYSTNTLEFNVNNNGDHVDMFALPNDEKLILIFAGT